MFNLKKLGLLFSLAVFCLSLSIISVSAQSRRSSWSNDNGRHRGWYRNNRSWNNGNRRQVIYNNNTWNRSGTFRIYTNGGYGNNDYRRLQRQRYNIYRNQNRYYRDGYLNQKERRKLYRQYSNYRRSVRRSW